MAGVLRVYQLGQYGVVVDSDDLHTPPGTWRSAQNLHIDPLGSADSVVNRAGLIGFCATATAGIVYGGIGVPLQDRTLNSGSRRFYLARGI